MAKRVKHEYSANMRRALYEGLLKAAKEEGMTLTEYCMRWWQDDWKAAINAMSKFVPREQQIEGEITHRTLIDVLTSIEEGTAEDTGVEEKPSQVRH